jgi:hypothetical protein
MQTILAIILALLMPRADAEALARTAPEHALTVKAAVQHLAAARVAALETGVDADLILSVAAHESHYESNAIGPESGGRVSCGTMTPTPVTTCVRVGLVEQYLAGARHLRGWIDAMHGNMRLGLIGYAGGFRLIAACAKGPVMIRPSVDACLTPDVFLWRAAWIKRERTRQSPTAS